MNSVPFSGAFRHTVSRNGTKISEGALPVAYELPPLPYDYAALEPHIDEQTMHFHHDKHHQTYVDKANAALAGTEWADSTPDEILQSLGKLPDDRRTAARNH